jgi:hypothetical protein
MMMKNLGILLLVALLGCSQPNQNYYGEKIDDNEVVSISQAKSLIENGEKANVKLEGEILATCEKKGCWMTMKMDDGEEIRVTFKDYGFFVPTSGAEGKKAIIAGETVKEITDVETLQHYAQDAGKSEAEIAAITEPKEEYNFVATGVIIVD